MGYWDETYDGRAAVPSDSDLMWGDRPADILGEALDRIIKVFERDLGRRPSEDEVRAGLEFALGGRVFPGVTPDTGKDTVDDRLWSLLEDITRNVDRFDADAEGWCDSWLTLLDYVVLVLVLRNYNAERIRNIVEAAMEDANEEEAGGWPARQIVKGLTYADAPGPVS